MAKEKITPIEANEDEVAEGVHETIVFLQNHYGKLIVLAVLVLAVLMGNSMIQSRNARISSEINNSLTSALGELNVIESQTDAAQRQQGVDKLVAVLDELVKAHPGEPLALEGIFLKGRAYYAADKYAEAQAAYNEFIGKVNNDQDRARGEIALGYAYENESFLVGDQDVQRDKLTAAQGRYQRAAQLAPGSYLYYYALMGEARVNELLSDYEKAIALYQKVVDERPAPMAKASDSEAKEGEDSATSEMIDYLKKTLGQFESQMSFQKTAELRLASLKARTGQATTTTQTIVVKP